MELLLRIKLIISGQCGHVVANIAIFPKLLKNLHFLVFVLNGMFVEHIVGSYYAVQRMFVVYAKIV